MTSEYNKSFSIGDRLILELGSKDIFEGIYADGGKDFVVLIDVIQHNNANKLEGLYEFYRREIVHIHRLKAPATKQETEPESDPKPEANCKVIKVGEVEYFRLRDMARDFTYIGNTDKRYYDAVKTLSESETVGVVCLGMEKARSRGFVQLLVLSTWKHVYIFDMINIEMRQLYPELKNIFQSEYCCKVMHKAAGFVDILYREYGVYMQNTFDIEVVDLILQKTKMGKCPSEGRDISECLEHYLNFPSSFLEDALSVPNKKWNDRPLSDKKKLYASQLATYLVVLKEHLQKLLLDDVYKAINTVQDRVYAMDDWKFLQYNNKKEVSKEIQDIIPDLKKLDFKG